MKPKDNYLDVNRQTWNEKTGLHLESDFYDHESFLRGRSSLNSIELELLGEVSGKDLLHLQCHFGQDTISLARMGAHCTGVDLSDKAIETAVGVAEKMEVAATFIRSDVYDLPRQLDQQFDIVFTSYGTIGWLPDLDKWAGVVAHFLKPGGSFVFVEFHPVIWMFDEDFSGLGYNYFNDGPIVETEEGTYADRTAKVSNTSVSWNHSLSEVVNSMIKNGLTINLLNEYDYSPYDCFRHTVEVGPGRFRIKHLGNKLPMVYAIQATKTQ
ncbi:class I SAM-dependent methyltransferase [Flavilitoribacter nigricans]|uniref:SAM-dependent methyltransferase n=1 Tax=Flavilitoribacter nigricans (strain ATCC 23147 / DSM 23189 / NBRC 102662 / NCIMB 1420 / SS-2) TaxID=1122177 RepID=A0A2D0NIY9_FLAN2|nr:class I SAM-dependent methyltransferase [Flavilitoribacter nigricans]PHN08464.1 SAM-dependent methyltransferase [Flavilitoribacter nigricans DSM 23189 = NBRC 102662]